MAVIRHSPIQEEALKYDSLFETGLAAYTSNRKLFGGEGAKGAKGKSSGSALIRH